MSTVIVTLEDKRTGERFTAEYQNYNGSCLCVLKKQIRRSHTSAKIVKITVKR